MFQVFHRWEWKRSCFIRRFFTEFLLCSGVRHSWTARKECHGNFRRFSVRSGNENVENWSQSAKSKQLNSQSWVVNLRPNMKTILDAWNLVRPARKTWEQHQVLKLEGEWCGPKLTAFCPPKLGLSTIDPCPKSVSSHNLSWGCDDWLCCSPNNL